MTQIPDAVAAAKERAAALGFDLSCDDGTGRLLCVLAVAVPEGGRILELGTGVGAGLAWFLDGLAGRTDVEIVSVELDDDNAKAAASVDWPEFVRLHHGDAVEIVPTLGTFDLIFPDAPGGKWTGLDATIAALRPHGVLVVDDMIPKPDFPDEWVRALERTREKLFAHPDLVCVEISDLTGVILCARRA